MTNANEISKIEVLEKLEQIKISMKILLFSNIENKQINHGRRRRKRSRFQ